MSGRLPASAARCWLHPSHVETTFWVGPTRYTRDSILTFFLDLPQTPVLFRIWSDASGLVHRASMRAQGHFMDHRYTDFETPVSIEPRG